MSPSHLIFLAVMAAPVLSGDVAADLSEAVAVEDPGGLDVRLPRELGVARSGNDLSEARFHYDAPSDTLYVGIATYGLAGDVDGDGNPDAASAALSALGGQDHPGFGGLETLAVSFDLDEDGVFDVIAGIPARGEPDAPASALLTAAFQGSTRVPGLAFGTPLPAHTGTLVIGDDVELTIPHFSSLPTTSAARFSPLRFRAQVYIGSLSDAGVDEDFLPGPGATSLIDLSQLAWSSDIPGLALRPVTWDGCDHRRCRRYTRNRYA